MEFVPKETKPANENEATTGSQGSNPEATSNVRVAKARTRSSSTVDAADIYQVRVNWLYRQQDVSRNATDSRQLFATMHSDVCPLHGIRGKCSVKLKDYIEDFESYVQSPNCFYFDKLYDRYIARFFDVIPTDKITNIPPKLQKVLQERFKYAVVESGRGKDLMSSPQSCEKCLQWCSKDDSVQCAHCKQHYHMLCLDPPITRKPTRGFGWSCASCSGAIERKLDANKGIFKNSRLSSANTEDQEMKNSSQADGLAGTTNGDGGKEPDTGSQSPSGQHSRYEELEAAVDKSLSKQLSAEQLHLQKMWPFRYLGMHSRLEDVLEFDDRIYPRAASRLGTKHQCAVPEWPGRPVVYVEREKGVRRRGRGAWKNRMKPVSSHADVEGSSSESGENNTSNSASSKKNRSPWIQEKPVGYIERGGELTSTLHWKNPPDHLEKVDEFLEKTKPYAEKIKMGAWSPNFIDAALDAYMECNYEEAPALKIVSTFTRKSLKEPTFTDDEKKRFADAVRKYGSELHPVYKEVGTKTSADVVRYYYLWKKTPEGHLIWDNFEGRKKNKKKADVSRLHNGLVDEVADSGDDSAYDNEKAKGSKRSFICKFCETTSVREWRRAPGYPVATDANPIVALCLRCAKLWRKYAVIWEEPDEVMRQVNQRGPGLKRKVEYELIEDAKAIYAERDKEMERERSRKKIKVEKQQKEKAAAVAVAAVVGSDKQSSAVKGGKVKSESKPGPKSKGRPRAEKRKLEEDREVEDEEVEDEGEEDEEMDESKIEEDSSEGAEGLSEMKAANSAQLTKLAARNAVIAKSAPSEREIAIPCSVCKQVGSLKRQLGCQCCGLNVHPQCYGIKDFRVPVGSSWLCDTCSNDQRPLVSTWYCCALCPVREHQSDTSTSGSMLTDGFKRTQDYRWAHVRCAIWTKEVEFGDHETLQPVQKLMKIPVAKLTAVCDVCTSTYGSCVKCQVCDANYHVGCAAKAGHAIGFEVVPVEKNSSTPIVTLGGETGKLEAVVSCSEHASYVNNLFRMSYIDPSTGKSVLQLYVEKYKQGDRRITGAMKRAEMFDPSNREASKLSDIVPAASSGTDLELVLSENPAKDASETQFSRGSVSCQSCHSVDAPYWFKTEDGVQCSDCYWKSKNRSLFEEVFRVNDRISIIDDPFLQAGGKSPESGKNQIALTNILNPAPTAPATEENPPESRRKLMLHDILT